MAPLGLSVGTLRVGHQAQMTDDPSQPRRIQPPGRFHQHRFGSAVTWAGRSWVPAASTWAWAGESSPSANAWAVRVRGPRYRARAVRTRLLAAPALMRKRLRSHPAVEEACTPWSAPAAPRASTAARVAQPLAFLSVLLPPQDQEPFDQGGVGEPVQLLGGQPIHRRHQRPQLGRARWSNVCSSP